MIWNSPLWKAELKKELRKFIKYQVDIRSDKYDADHFVFGLEKFYFTCAFIIRKLVENNKLSDEFMSSNFKVSQYRRINKTEKLDTYNYLDFAKYYSLENESGVQFNVNRVCNLFIHSFVFFPTFDEEMEMAFTGVFINSDHSMDGYIYHIDFSEFERLINGVLEDEIVYIQTDRSTGKSKRSRNLPSR
jgi:hypothetical protein